MPILFPYVLHDIDTRYQENCLLENYPQKIAPLPENYPPPQEIALQKIAPNENTPYEYYLLWKYPPMNITPSESSPLGKLPPMKSPPQL